MKLSCVLKIVLFTLFLLGCTPEEVSNVSGISVDSANQQVVPELRSIILERGQTYYASESPMEIQATTEGCESVVFKISGNGARFTDGGTSLTVDQCGQVMVPDVAAGEQSDTESTISAFDNNGNRLAELRAATVVAGSMDAIASTWPSASFTMGAGYALLDESYKTAVHTKQGVRTVASADGSKTEERGFCWRKAWGPGRAEWKMDNPWPVHGYKYIKEGNSNRLFGPEGNATVKRSVDAFCRTNWRPHKAIKVPDSCTTKISKDHGWSSCCNAAMAAAGHKVKVIYTGDGAKPDWAKEKIAAWDSCKN